MTAPAGLLDRIGGRLFPQQSGLEGLLTEEDYKNAQRQGMLSLGAGLLAQSGPSTVPVGFGQAVGRALQGAQDTYQGALGSMTERRGQAATIGNLRLKQQQAEAAAQGRAQILAKYPMPDGKNPDALRQWIDQTLPMWVQVDPETAGRLVEVRKTMNTDARNPQQVDLGGKVVLRDPATGQIVFEGAKTAPPRDTAAGEEQRAEMTRQRTFTREQQLARQFEARTKDFAEIADKAMVVFESARDPSAAGDLSLIFAYMKLLDPGSVVREGEFATAANTGSVPESVWGKYNRIIAGERLAQPVRDDFVQRARMLVRGNQGRLRHIMGQYERRARANGVDPSMVVYDYFDGMDAPEVAPPVRPPLSSFNFGGAPRQP
jgi:hypothetical protein